MRSRLVISIAVSGLLLASLAIAAASQTQGVEDLVKGAFQRAAQLKSVLTGEAVPAATAGVQAYRDDAARLAAGNRERLRKGMTYLAPTERIDPYSDDGTAMDGDGGVVYVAVSLSMPAAALRQIARDANQAGAILVIRGLVGNSFAKTRAALMSVFEAGEGAGLVIDPRVFEQYDVERVPAVIAAPEPVAPCEDGLRCKRTPVPFDIVRGNISLKAALSILAERGDAAPEVAKLALRRMGG